MKVTICIPSFDDWKADFAISLCGLLRYLDAMPLQNGTRVEALVLNYRQSIISLSRHTLMIEALRQDPDWVFWLDSDMVFPPNILHRLLESGRSAIGANCPRREVPNASGVIGTAANVTDEKPLGWSGSGLREVEWCGMACFLVKADIVRQIPQPWFGHEATPNQHIGEDAYFCKKLRAYSHRIFIDLDLSRHIGHIVTAPIFWNGIAAVPGRPIYIVPGAQALNSDH